MTALVKATLRELPATEGAPPIGEPVNVQFNPTTLRVQISNKSAGGQQAGSQARQRPGTGEMTVSFDLIFDTADEGSTTAPVPVTRKTMTVEKFVRPRGSAPNQQTPPRVEFRWGTFLVQGVMESANIDLELFAADGTPLRAKVAVSIKGQNPEYRYDPILPATAASAGNTGGPPPGPHAPPAGAPGTTGGSETPASVAQAMPGESLQQLAARHGLDPGAWRALAAGLSDPLSLAAGQEVALPTALNMGQGLAGRERSTAALPLVATDSLPARPETSRAGAAASSSDALGAGQALAGSGGLTQAIRHLRDDAHQKSVAQTRQGFGLPPAAAAQDTDAPPSALERPWGAGVPLRPRYGQNEAPLQYDPTTPRWLALPEQAGPAARAPGRKRPPRNCHCDCGTVRRK